ncbi:MAG: BON domain-containing protein [Chloroflexi bacterium]|nr:BON domain-containing protein [Chloroflexota bacterium]
MRYWLGVLTGLLLMYFIDPALGRRRRADAGLRLGSAIRRAGRVSERTRRRVEGDLYGVHEKAAHPTWMQELPANDADLAQKVMTVLFRDPSVPKGDINVNAQMGVVQLRGEVREPQEIRRIEDTVRGIRGVVDVENLLHLPHTPAPRS